MRRVTFLALMLLVYPASSVFAQIGNLELTAPLGVQKPGSAENAADKVETSLVANVQSIQPGKTFKLGILFKVPKGYYAFYKSPGAIGLPTNLTVSAPEGFEVGPLQWPGPDVKHVDLGKTHGANFVYKRDTVVFAEVKAPKDLKPETEVTFTGTSRFQYCKEDGSCFPPIPKKLSLKLPVAWTNAQVEPSEVAGKFDSAQRNLPVSGSESKYAKIEAKLDRDKLAPGLEAQLQVIVNVEDGYHIQMHKPPVPGLISTDVITELPESVKLNGSVTYPSPQSPKKPLPGMDGVKEYHGQVVINVPIQAKDSLTGDSVTLAGLLRYQACTDDGTCYPPIYASFSTTVPVTTDQSEVSAAQPVVATSDTGTGTGSGSSGGGSGGSSGFLDDLKPVDADAGQSLGVYFLYAFLGGLILNVMPCVLPVVAIKVLSFVQQAGESRSRILALNVVYSLGILTVFMLLATLAVVLGIGWGGLFQREEFNLVMAGLVFAMGLSLLGVFEIPVPGFVGSAAGGAHREGLLGAYLTGIFATLLATPCSGPFLGVTLGWSVRQEVHVTYATWALMGLGMSFPYLLIGAFPAAIKFLPKPGTWMVRFKELAGLVLMGTVVFIITFLNETYTIPALVMLVGLALGLYMIGNLYDINSHIKRKATVLVSALVLTTGICLFAFTFMKDVVESRRERDLQRLRQQFVEEIDVELKGKLSRPLSVMLAEAQVGQETVADSAELPWQPFSQKRLEELLTQGKSVLVDFTADWCLTCKTNEMVALNTKETRQLVEDLKVVPLYADFTERSPEIQEILNKFGSISVPLTVIFPGDRPTEPIILRDTFTKARLLDALRQAGTPAGTQTVSQANSPATR